MGKTSVLWLTLKSFQSKGQLVYNRVKDGPGIFKTQLMFKQISHPVYVNVCSLKLLRG